MTWHGVLIGLYGVGCYNIGLLLGRRGMRKKIAAALYGQRPCPVCKAKPGTPCDSGLHS